MRMNFKGKYYRKDARTARMASLIIAIALAAVTWKPAFAAESTWMKNQSIEAGGFISNNLSALASHYGRIWAGTDKGLVWTASNGRTWQQADLPAANRIWAKPEDAASPDWSEAVKHVTCILPQGHHIWVGTHGGLFVGSEKGFYFVGGEKGLPATGIIDIAGRGRYMYLVSREGIFRSDSAGISWHHMDALSNLYQDSERAFSNVAFSENVLWFGRSTIAQTPGQGFAIFRGEHNGSEFHRVWFGAELEPGISNIRLNFIKSKGAEVWVGTSIGLFHSRDEGNRWRHISATSGLLSNNVMDILIADRRIWAATANGISYSDNGGLRWNSDRYPRGSTNALVADRLALWVGTEGGLLRRLSDGRYWDSFSSRSETRAVAVQEIDGRKRWWVGTSGGIALSTNGGRNWRFYSVADRLPSNVVNGIAVDGEDVWVATEGGLAHMEGTADYWRRYGMDNGLLSDQITGIAAANGSVWASTKRGVSTFDAHRGQFRTMRQLMGWEHVACDGEWVITSTTHWDQDILEEYLETNIEPLRAPMFRFYRWHERRGGWEEMSVEGYTGGEVYSLAIYNGVFWIVSEAGLFRSLDSGRTWNRYGSETLWGPSARNIAPFPDGGLMVQSTLINPPSPWGIWSVTIGDGKEWFTLKPRLPASVNATAIDGNKVICAAEDGLYVLERATNDMLAQDRPGWRSFHKMALLAASYRQGDFQTSVEYDPWSSHGVAYWIAPKGRGPLLKRSMPLSDVAYPRHNEPAEQLRGPVGESIETIYAEPDAVWFGSEKGATRHDRVNDWKFYQLSDGGIRGRRIKAIARLGDDMWFGTGSGCSIMGIESGEWHHIEADGRNLPSGGVTALASQDGIMWIGTTNGLFRYSEADGVTPAVRGIEVISAVAGDYAVCAGSDRGLYIVDESGDVSQRLVPENSRLPANRVAQVILDGNTLWAGAGGAFVRLDVVTKVAEEHREPTRSKRGPEGVLVVINENCEDSVRVGEHYALIRKIPPENICRINAPREETVSRSVYENEIKLPIRRHMLENGISQRISFVVTTYGVPLRIAPEDDITDGETSRDTTRASVDSELAHLGRSHPLAGPLPNRYSQRDQEFDSTRFGMYLVTRLDGPTPEAAIALIDRAVETEERGLFAEQGIGYFETGTPQLSEHTRIIEAIQNNHKELDRQLKIGGRLEIRGRFNDDDIEEPAFIYLGWRGLGEPAPALQWTPGAIAVFLDPITATSMNDINNSIMARAVSEGITAGIGSAFNPTVASWSCIERLISRVNAGYYWAEAAGMSLRYVSWDHVIIGDPLYKPLP